jgi:hypothetical protein
MAGSKVPSDPNMSSEVRRFLDDRAKRETSNEARLDALETATATLVFATEAQAQTGTSTTLYMSPARVVDTIYAWSPFLKFAHYQDQKASGTDGGDFTSGAWRLRDLNTEVYDNIGITLGSNLLTLPAGTYYIDASAPAFRNEWHQCRLYNNTAAAVILLGTNERSGNTATGPTSSGGRSLVRGRFVLSGSSNISIEHRTSGTRNGDGFGSAGSVGTEVYTDVMLWKLSE